jgi:hypothetical protein
MDFHLKLKLRLVLHFKFRINVDIRAYRDIYLLGKVGVIYVEVDSSVEGKEGKLSYHLKTVKIFVKL